MVKAWGNLISERKKKIKLIAAEGVGPRVLSFEKRRLLLCTYSGQVNHLSDLKADETLH